MTWKFSWHGATLVLACVFLATAPFAAAQVPTGQAPPHKAHPPATPQSIAQGKMIFDGTCAVCHGVDGGGANGPNIQGAARTMGPEGLYNRVWGGVIGSGMPNFSYLGEDKIWDVVDYVGTLGQATGAAATGDPQKGKEAYQSSGCASCHSIDGRGGDSGPDLSDIGSERSASFLRDELLNPGANKPNGEPGLPSRAAYGGYRMYRVTLANGKVATGTRVNESSFSLQLRDAHGNIISVDKLKARSIEELPNESFMPSYKGKLSEAQLNDVVAYLASLEVRR
ncbi:MAG: c-type cytochrome [Acidobacteriota bacterium]|nr:c-type cytochrome [Acidobacteriota bacterium]